MSQTSESIKRNLSRQTKHAKKSKENKKIQNAYGVMLTCLELHNFVYHYLFTR